MLLLPPKKGGVLHIGGFSVNKTQFFLNRFVSLFVGKRVTRASAGLSYYLTMTLFPLIICLYTLLGNRYTEAMRILNFVESLFPTNTIKFLEDFLLYVAVNTNRNMLIAGLLVLVTSSSAAYRTVFYTIGELQGKLRYQGVIGFLLSIAFSLFFLLMVYFGILVMLTGGRFMAFLDDHLPFIALSGMWNWLRFVLLFAIAYVMISIVYASAQPRHDKYPIFAGSIVGTLLLVAVSIIFSLFISASARYPLVYGSLASIVLMMLWLYTCCIVLLCGAVVNVVLRDLRREKTLLQLKEQHPDITI